MSLLLKVLTLIIATAQLSRAQVYQTVDVADPAAVENFIQLHGGPVGGAHNCLGNVTGAITDSMNRSYRAVNEKTNMLMQNASTRFGHLKECRNELQQGWLDFERAKAEHKQVTNELESKVRDAEINYKLAVLKLEKECRASSDKQFEQYRNNIYGNVLSDPTQTVNFNQNVNRQRKFLYDSCYRDPLNVKSLGLLGNKFDSATLKMETEIQNSKDALESMQRQINQIQANTLENCEDQGQLNDYNESLANQMLARGISLAKRQSTMEMMSAVMSCVDPGQGLRRPTSSSSRPTDTSR